jgi:hypothetical protein
MEERDRTEAAPEVPRSSPATAADASVSAQEAVLARLALLAGRPGPARMLALQRSVGNAAVGRLLSRSVSPAPAVPAGQLPGVLRGIDRAVQDVLHRRGRTRVMRPHGGWATYEAADERIDFDWTALLFVLHRSEPRTGGEDYLTVLERLMIPALREAAGSETGRTPEALPNLDILTAGMWARNPPAYVRTDRRFAERYRQVIQTTRVEELLTEAGTRARQANITDQSIPGRRDQDYAFIMGAPEGARAHNQFYRRSRDYYRRVLGNGHVQVVQSLEDVLDWIRRRAAAATQHHAQIPPLGTLYLVSHANEQGSLMTKMTRNGPHGFFPFQLEQAVGPNGRTWNDARGHPHIERLAPLASGLGVDGWTRIFIRGCDIGREPRALNAIRTAFGGDPLVHAPRHAQYYGPTEINGGQTGEGLADTYSLALPATPRLDDDAIADRLAAAYGAISRDTFRDWLRRGRAGGRQGQSTYQVSDYSVSSTFTYDYAAAADVPQAAAEREAAIRSVIAGDPEIARLFNPNEASWRYAVAGRSLTGTGTIRYVHLHVVRRDAAGHLRSFGVRDREAYGIDVRPVSQDITSVPWR